MLLKRSCSPVLVSVVCLSLQAPAVSDDSMGVFDTGTASRAVLSGRVVAERAGWTKIPEGQSPSKLKGDTAFSNGRLTVVLRKAGPGAELYSHGQEGPTLRAVLMPAVGKSGAGLASVAIVENTSSQAAVDVTFQMPDGTSAALRLGLQLGQVFVKTERRGNLKALRLEAPCRFVVMPDFFADDIAIDATELPEGDAELPSENFLLHMVGRGEAILAAVWDQREEDVRIAVVGDGKNRTIRASTIPYGSKGSVYVAVLGGPSIWHSHDVAKADADRIMRLDWKAPFVAQWRVDWRQDDGLVDSWEMLLERPDGAYFKPDWFGQSANYGTDDWMQSGRKRWTTVLGYFQYPCWIDKGGRGHLQPLKKPGRFDGPAVLYPLGRVRATPLTALTVVDLMRATLGVGPCRYVLDVEGQKKQSAGIPTCDAKAVLDAIYTKNQQKKRSAEVEQALADALAFIRHIRARIEAYVTFGHETLAYLDEEKKTRPELAEFISELEEVTRGIDRSVAARKGGIATPEYAALLVDKFRDTLVDYEGPDALAKCKKITAGFVRIGGNQDELVGECRMPVKILRQKAGLAMAVDPRTAPVAKEIRRRTQEMLRNPVSYEAPRH